MIDFYAPLSALHAEGIVTQTIANNIANVNTDGYKSQMVHLESGPLDRGVVISSVYRDMSPGPAVLYDINERDVRDMQDMAAQNMRNRQENYDSAQVQDVARFQQSVDTEYNRVFDSAAGLEASHMYHSGLVEGSNTDVARDFTKLIISENVYGAQASVIRAMDEMTGSILNVKV